MSFELVFNAASRSAATFHIELEVMQCRCSSGISEKMRINGSYQSSLHQGVDVAACCIHDQHQCDQPAVDLSDRSADRGLHRDAA
ncbi:hypothetical protein ALP81_200098 [Pseudomonas savastanoi pv. fraxini]|nr:hypothetical protein ALP81_200098 [Pseudomonas savastanoi pv. fraxini]